MFFVFYQTRINFVVLMGFTRYFSKTRDFTDEEWKQITEKFKQEYQTYKNSLENKKTNPPNKALDCTFGEVPSANKFYDDILEYLIVDDDKIEFNGINGCETFSLTKNKIKGGWEFCKTKELPYDQVVCIALLASFKIAPEVLNIMSD